MLEDDFPITLQEACNLFPQSKFKISTLKTAADKGMLKIFLLGKRLHTTRAAMSDWVKACQDVANRRACIWTPPDSNSSSETERASSALAAANETVTKLKNISRNTSRPNINRKALARR